MKFYKRKNQTKDKIFTKDKIKETKDGLIVIFDFILFQTNEIIMP